MGIENDLTEIKEFMRTQANLGKIKEKKWKFPFGKKVGAGQKRKNFVTTLILNENGNYEFKKYIITDQTIVHDLIPRLASAGYVMFDKRGNPLVILPNWSVQPFSPLEHYNKSLIDGSNVNGYKLLMAKMQKEQIKPTTQISGWVKWVVGLVIAGIIIYAIFTGGGS